MVLFRQHKSRLKFIETILEGEKFPLRCRNYTCTREKICHTWCQDPFSWRVVAVSMYVCMYVSTYIHTNIGIPNLNPCTHLHFRMIGPPVPVIQSEGSHLLRNNLMNLMIMNNNNWKSESDGDQLETLYIGPEPPESWLMQNPYLTGLADLKMYM